MEKEKCLNCNEILEGRAGKIFCTPYCKSNYHYEKNKAKAHKRFAIVDKQLKLNRKLLAKYNKAGKSTIRAEKMNSEGFDPMIFTNYWKNQKGDTYLFCYEYGFLKRIENEKIKYILVTWQDYMKN